MEELREENRRLAGELCYARRCLDLMHNYRNCLVAMEANCRCDRNQYQKFVFRLLEKEYSTVFTDETRHAMINNVVTAAQVVTGGASIMNIDKSLDMFNHKLDIRSQTMSSSADDNSHRSAIESTIHSSAANCSADKLAIDSSHRPSSDPSNDSNHRQSAASSSYDSRHNSSSVSLNHKKHTIPATDRSARHKDSMNANESPSSSSSTMKNSGQQQHMVAITEDMVVVKMDEELSEISIVSDNTDDRDKHQKLGQPTIGVSNNHQLVDTFQDYSFGASIASSSHYNHSQQSDDGYNNASHDKSSYKCLKTGCNLIFELKTQMEDHLDQSHPHLRPYKCDTCKKTFKKSNHLARHKCRGLNDDEVGVDLEHVNSCRVSNGGGYRCDWPDCDRVVATKHSFISHIRTHRCEYPFACDMCEKRYTKKDCLIRHIKLFHASAQIHDCPFDGCDYRTPYNWLLNKHMMSRHMNTKSFKCDLQPCKSRFHLKGQLVQHKMRKHGINVGGGGPPGPPTGAGAAAGHPVVVPEPIANNPRFMPHPYY
ncbi:zinc finger protein interacting with ribonucleoprotein K-like [Oppia nitens]|uniref:zinc finger protein interacting with ribonucleoprotein K-like n=1 Tax=Oppia nitens TaxID=1686743 RepID=UPI0023DA1785|nr:zinc finger protein interacting with ribonucleoprotein K-like [Oppia nitens]